MSPWGSAAAKSSKAAGLRYLTPQNEWKINFFVKIFFFSSFTLQSMLFQISNNRMQWKAIWVGKWGFKIPIKCQMSLTTPLVT